MGTRVYDPLSVRSVAFCLLLAAALKTTLLRHGFYFRATVVFRCVLRTSQKNYSCTAGISACSSAFSKSQILCICSLYLLSIRLYSCLFYHVNIVVVICQEQSSAPWLRWCLHALFPDDLIFTSSRFLHPCLAAGEKEFDLPSWLSSFGPV